MRLLESCLSDPFFLKSQRNQPPQVSHQLFQDLKVGSYVRIYSVPLESFENRPKCSNRKSHSMVEIRLKVDISHDIIENYDCTLYLRPSHTKTLHLSLGSKKRTTNILDANSWDGFQVEVSWEVKKIRKIFSVLVRSRTCKWFEFFHPYIER